MRSASGERRSAVRDALCVQYGALVDEHTQALARAIGERVRHERQTRRWTLDELAGATGVSRRALVNVEQGAANPSVATLLRISDALGVGLPALVEPPDSGEPTEVTVTRKGSGAVLWTSEAGGRGELVAGTSPPDVVELWEWSLGVGDRYASDPHAPGTRELVHVTHGRITIVAAERSVSLSAGDAASFRGDVPHSYAHELGKPARFVMSVFEPGVGTVLAPSGGGR